MWKRLMLKKNSLRTRRQQNALYIWTFIAMISCIVLLLNYADLLLSLGLSAYLNYLYLIVISLVLFIQLCIWIIRNKAYKSFIYALHHYSIVRKLRKSFIEANYYNKKIYNRYDIAVLPHIKLSFNSDYSKAKLLIENININKDISTAHISFALNHYIVDRVYLSSNENYQVFEIYDSRVSNQLHFASYQDFKVYSKKFDDYSLFIDKSLSIPLQSSLLVGQTGSGKTYALYSFILQMITKEVKYNLYFADPKNSSLAILGEALSSANTATDIDHIIALLQEFNKAMDSRKKEIKMSLNKKLDGSYSDFKYEPHIFIFDEFASFQSVLQTMEKKKRDEVMKLLSQVVLQGRQLGFFLWIIMQKSDATLLPTNLRENLPAKFVLGNAEKQTYITSFGTGIEIPSKNFQQGEGVLTCPIIASTPKICHFSYLDFDILSSLKE